jgi:hypothetical protein
MRFRITIIVAACAFTVPLILLGLIEMWNGSFPTSLADIYTLAINWLYMSASHLMAVLISFAFRPARRYFLPCSLIALSVALTAFWCWIMWWVPPHESGLASVLYIPLSVIVLVLVAFIAFWWQRSENTAKRA